MLPPPPGRPPSSGHPPAGVGRLAPRLGGADSDDSSSRWKWGDSMLPLQKAGLSAYSESPSWEGLVAVGEAKQKL